jgi:hypothetical protein
MMPTTGAARLATTPFQPRKNTYRGTHIPAFLLIGCHGTNRIHGIQMLLCFCPRRPREIAEMFGSILKRFLHTPHCSILNDTSYSSRALTSCSTNTRHLFSIKIIMETGTEYRLNVRDPRLEVPAEIQARLSGRDEVKRYDVDDAVFQWIRSLPDAMDGEDANGENHRFLAALKYDMCHAASFHEGVVSGAFRGVVNNPRAAFFVFDPEGMIVGFSVVSTTDVFPEDLFREVTCTGVRGRGLGRKLDQAVVAYARELGKTHVRLHPTEDAKPIHIAMGFREDPANHRFLIKDVLPVGGKRNTRRKGKRTFRRKNKQWTRRR